MEDIGQAHGIEEAQHGRGIGALHVIQFGDGALQNDGARYGKNHERNNQYDAGLDGTQGLPGFANHGAKGRGHNVALSSLSSNALSAPIAPSKSNRLFFSRLNGTQEIEEESGMSHNTHQKKGQIANSPTAASV